MRAEHEKRGFSDGSLLSVNDRGKTQFDKVLRRRFFVLHAGVCREASVNRQHHSRDKPCRFIVDEE